MIVLPRSARRGPLFFILAVILIVGVLLYRSRFLFGLLFEDGKRDAIYPGIVLDPSYDSNNAVPVIPKIIHQTYKNDSIPKEWHSLHRQTLNMSQTNGYEYMFWTDDSAYDFLRTNYPWFLPTYESYSYGIQRADALRYFLLVHYGGIYLDLDIAPYRPLDILLPYPAWACRTLPTGISNDALGAIPNHPFYLHVINSLAAYNRKLVAALHNSHVQHWSAVLECYVGRISADAPFCVRRLPCDNDRRREVWEHIRLLQ